jgi:hypothetical protein
MTEPSPSRPLPGPPPSPQLAADQAEPQAAPGIRAVPEPGDEESGLPAEPFPDLTARPVAEHVAIFEAEHSRLKDELSTIDQL